MDEVLRHALKLPNQATGFTGFSDHMPEYALQEIFDVAEVETPANVN
jgi:hypothetical protein